MCVEVQYTCDQMCLCTVGLLVHLSAGFQLPCAGRCDVFVRGVGGREVYTLDCIMLSDAGNVQVLPQAPQISCVEVRQHACYEQSSVFSEPLKSLAKT